RRGRRPRRLLRARLPGAGRSAQRLAAGIRQEPAGDITRYAVRRTHLGPLAGRWPERRHFLAHLHPSDLPPGGTGALAQPGGLVRRDAAAGLGSADGGLRRRRLAQRQRALGIRIVLDQLLRGEGVLAAALSHLGAERLGELGVLIEPGALL